MKSKVRILAERSCRQATGGGGMFRRGICLPCEIRTGKPDRRGCFSFNSVTGFYQCFKCAIVGRLDGYEDGDIEAPEVERPEMRPPQGFYELTRGEGKGAESLAPARRFLKKRGLTDEAVWKAAHVGACIEGFFSDRVVVPVLAPDKEWLGFVARAWVKKHEVPYLYPRGFNRREVLYNHRALLPEEYDSAAESAARLSGEYPPVFVVEGVLDALALWPHSVAVLGKPSDPQVFALADSPHPIVVCLDGDAWREGEELAMRLQLEGQRAGSIRLPPKTDPDEVPRQWLEEEARRCLS